MKDAPAPAAALARGSGGGWLRAAPWLLLGFLGLIYALTPPGTVNGDGVGYLRQIPGDKLAPGHVGYLPLARAVAALVPHQTLLELVWPLRLVSLVAALGALALLLAAARRLLPAGPALFTTALLGVSHALGRAASEVEVYGLALLPVAALIYGLVRLSHSSTAANAMEDAPAGDTAVGAAPHAGATTGGAATAQPPMCAANALGWAAAAGALWGVATLLHLSLVLLAPSVVLLLWLCSPRPLRSRCLLVGLLAMGLCGPLPIVAAGLDQGQQSLLELWHWLQSADHGLPYPHSWRTPLAALWGMSKSLVYAPYPYEASWPRVAALSLIGAGLLGSLIWRAWKKRRRLSLPAPLRLIALLLGLPILAFGVTFYPSDTERWLFGLPLAALLLAPAADRIGVGLLCAAALINLASDRLPRHLDQREPTRAAQAEALLGPRDLLICPGHGWDELVGLGSPAPPRRLSLVSLVGQQRSLPRALERLQQRLDQALQGGRRVFVARLEDRVDQRGFKELARQGLPPAGFARLFESYRKRPTAVPQLWQVLAP